MIESYAYDALGRRVATTTANGTERHVYDDNWKVIADLDANGNVLRSYVWDAGIDRLLAVKIGSRTYTAHTDVQGTVWAFSDEQGNAAAVFGYDAWGNVLSRTYAPGAEALAGVRYGFQGREHSQFTGFIHFRMRWYDPVTGRWLSKDPIRLQGGMNLYAFCANAGTSKRDPCGCAVSQAVGFIIAAGITAGWVAYKIWHRAKCTQDEMNRRNIDDFADGINGALQSVKGLLGDIVSPFGAIPDSTSPIIDPIGGKIVEPIIDILPIFPSSREDEEDDMEIRPLP